MTPSIFCPSADVMLRLTLAYPAIERYHAARRGGWKLTGGTVRFGNQVAGEIACR